MCSNEDPVQPKINKVICKKKKKKIKGNRANRLENWAEVK